MKPAIDSHMLLAAGALEKIPVTDRITTVLATWILRLQVRNGEPDSALQWCKSGITDLQE